MARPSVRSEPTPKRVRALRRADAASGRGAVVVDTTGARLVWEHDHFPVYYVPTSDLAGRLTDPADDGATIPADPAGPGPSDALGAVRRHDLRLPDGDVIRDAIWSHPDVDDLVDHVRLDAAAFDWFEEDEPVLAHPRSPYVRVDCLRSSRHVRIEHAGVVLGACANPVMVYETGLDPRVYVPRTALRLDRFVPSPTTSVCPYKGHATYLSLDVEGTVIDDVCWSYRTPLIGASAIADLVGIAHETLDVFIDGKRHSAQN